jgi:iron complex outermembrane receptor protein
VNSDPIPPGQQIVCPGRLACIWQTPGGEPSNLKTITEGETRQTSGFGSLEFDVRDDLTVLGELRYTQERKTADTLSNAALPGVDPDGAGKSDTWNFWNPRFSVTWRVNPDSIVYASAAKGTKAGGFNGNATTPADFSYDPENNWTYELGTKNTLFDGRLRANLAVYHIDWTGLQVQGPSSDPRTTAFVVQNLGSVTANGAELELDGSLAEGVTMRLGLAYTDPTYNGDALDFSGVATCRLVPSCAPRVVTVATPQGPRAAVSLEGLLQQRVSQWQFTTRLEAQRPIGADVQAFGAIGYSLQSKQYQQIQNLRWVGNRHVGDLRAGLEYRKVRVTAWVENLFDDITPYVGGGSNIRLNTLTFGALATVPEGRRYGVSAVVRFE